MKEKSKIRHFQSRIQKNKDDFPYGGNINTIIFVFGTIFIHIYPFTLLSNINYTNQVFIYIIFIIILLIINDALLYKKTFNSNYVYELNVNLEQNKIELTYFYKQKPIQNICLNLTDIRMIEKNSFSVLPNTITWTAFRIKNIHNNVEYIVSKQHWDNSVYNVLLSFLKSEIKKL
jgi:hypothetical protein